MARVCRWRAIALIAIGMLGCDEEVFVKGIVRGPTGAPLEGVSVTFTNPGQAAYSVKTPSDGTFRVGMINADPERANVSFEKDGFQRVERSLDGRPQWAMDITLTPKTNP
jgi:hypothetical protein